MEAKPLLNSLGQAFKIKVKSSSFGKFKYLPQLKTQLTNQRHFIMVPKKRSVNCTEKGRFDRNTQSKLHNNCIPFITSIMPTSKLSFGEFIQIPDKQNN